MKNHLVALGVITVTSFHAISVAQSAKQPKRIASGYYYNGGGNPGLTLVRIQLGSETQPYGEVTFDCPEAKRSAGYVQTHLKGRKTWLLGETYSWVETKGKNSFRFTVTPVRRSLKLALKGSGLYASPGGGTTECSIDTSAKLPAQAPARLEQ